MSDEKFIGCVEPDERSHCKNCGVLIGRYTNRGVSFWWHNDSGFDNRCAPSEAEPMSVERKEPCGAWGGCTLAKGHNRGKVDIPANHEEERT